jgi:hypothetical protein
VHYGNRAEEQSWNRNDRLEDNRRMPNMQHGEVSRATKRGEGGDFAQVENRVADR